MVRKRSRNRKSSFPKIKLNKGTLSGNGYNSKDSVSKREAALRRAVKMYGGTSIGRKLNYLATVNKNKNPDLSKLFKRDANWVNKLYTASGKRSNSRRTRRRTTKKSSPKRKTRKSSKRRTRKRSTKRRSRRRNVKKSNSRRRTRKNRRRTRRRSRAKRSIRRRSTKKSSPKRKTRRRSTKRSMNGDKFISYILS